MASIDLQGFNFTPTQFIALVVVTSPALYLLCTAFYNIYLSPLRKFPGPKSWACSEFFFQRAVFNGVAHREHLRLHEQYGPIVRLTPKELIFNSGQAFRDLYGTSHVHQGGKKEVLSKDERVYNNFGMKYDHMNCTLDHGVNARQRRMLGPAFSEKSVKAQEPMLLEHIDKLVAGVRRQGIERGEDVHIKEWINYTTFDVTGSLVFGESFHCLENAALHPWVAFITNSIKATILMGLFLRVPGLKTLMPYLTPKKVATAFKEHQALSLGRLEQRLEQGTDKADLIGLLLKNGITKQSGGLSSGRDQLSKGELHANTSVLIMAGSETSSTLVTGTIFLLLTHPASLSRLTEEIHSCSPTTALEASKLSYLQAVFQETLRIYPPAASSFSRRTPPGGAVIDGVYVPGNTYVGFPHYAAYKSSSNFVRASEWIPERWLDGENEQFDQDKKDALQPFSLGPYSCLGITLAWAEIRLILCKLLLNFDLKLCPGQERWYEDQINFLVWEKPPLKVRVTAKN